MDKRLDDFDGRPAGVRHTLEGPLGKAFIPRTSSTASAGPSAVIARAAIRFHAPGS